MRFLKGFEKFNEEFTGGETITKPATPITKPGTKPGRPSPIKRDRPSVDPNPKAELKTATEKEVVSKFINLLKDEGEDIKKYIK